MKSPSTTMSMMIVTLWWTIFSATTTTTTMACRCNAEPTLDLILQDEIISIFRGMIVPQSLFSSSSSKDNSFNEYTVLIQKVYQNQCRRPDLVVPPFLSSSSPSSAVVVALPPLLQAYQTITITSSKNSCGITTLPLFRTFLFSGVVSFHKQDRTRTLQEEGEEENFQYLPTQPNTTSAIISSTIANNSIIRSPTLRRTVYTDDDDTSVFVHVNLCQYMKTWRSVTRAEKTSLSNLTPVASTATTGTDSMTSVECSGGN